MLIPVGVSRSVFVKKSPSVFLMKTTYIFNLYFELLNRKVWWQQSLNGYSKLKVLVFKNFKVALFKFSPIGI